jgi:hypothetical protein
MDTGHERIYYLYMVINVLLNVRIRCAMKKILFLPHPQLARVTAGDSESTRARSRRPSPSAADSVPTTTPSLLILVR